MCVCVYVVDWLQGKNLTVEGCDRAKQHSGQEAEQGNKQRRGRAGCTHCTKGYIPTPCLVCSTSALELPSSQVDVAKLEPHGSFMESVSYFDSCCAYRAAV